MKSKRTALAMATAAALTIALPGPAVAAATFPVMNTSESLPDGVWFRNSPHSGDTDRITGLGVYRGEQVNAECYLMGDAVGSYGNRVWYLSANLSRPTVAGRANRGYLNTHYIDDGMTANHVAPGVPPCGAASTQQAAPPTPPKDPAPQVVFYSGVNVAGASKAREVGADRVLIDGRDPWHPWRTYDGFWSPKAHCTPDAKAINFGGLTINRLAGWSLGRLGPIYALRYMYKNDQSLARGINYVILYDPGTPTALGDCDYDAKNTNVQASHTLAWWLSLSTNNRLIIMSGNDTAINGHASIQNAYFPAIKLVPSVTIRKQVLVCNYKLNHEDTYNNYAYLMKADRLSTTQGLDACPRQGNTRVWGWNP